MFVLIEYSKFIVDVYYVKMKKEIENFENKVVKPAQNDL
jgi:hypothetical protein